MAKMSDGFCLQVTLYNSQTSCRFWQIDLDCDKLADIAFTSLLEARSLFNESFKQTFVGAYKFV
jgi:hypothetical protein